MSFSELTAEYGSVENIPNHVLYEFLRQPQTQAVLREVTKHYKGSDGSKRVVVMEAVRKQIVTDPAFTASMTSADRAELVRLFFPEYAEMVAA